ncbi:YbgA family protein [Billgrantia sp. LNSP4103-1]|uniref:YbgA family protein n=1 Tax=Billgrantia sp. LNSP4103-1 TaxID=3410266 RepID=UPI00403F4856
MVETISSSPPVPVGISACLMGEPVRYNGGHKRSRYCLEVLQECFAFEPFCPELEAGLGVPRAPIRLVGSPGEASRVKGTVDPSLDVTERLREVGETFVARHRHLRGFILMKGSPSCGLERVKVYHDNGMPSHTDSGLFVRVLREHFPELPLEEEARLNDAVLRENFITRVFAFDDWKRHVEEAQGFHALIQFHSRQKYLLMAHHVEAYRELGRYLGSEAHGLSLGEVKQHYLQRFMAALSRPATRKSHTNALMHVLGYLKRTVDSEVKQDLLQAVEEYRLGHVPLAVPLRLLNHYVKRHGSDYIRRQTYLDPHPYELGLRNTL